MATNDDLVVKIKADIKALQSGLRQAAKEADIAGKAMERGIGGSMDRVNKALSSAAGFAKTALVGLGAGAAAAGGAFILAEQRALEFADGLVKAADKTGVSIEALQELRYVAGQFGVELEELDGGLEKYTQLLGKAQAGNKTARESFRALGVSVTDASGAPRQTEQVLMDVLRVLERIPDAATRAAAAQEVFGKSGIRMAVLASQGAGAIEDLTAQARKMGLVIDGDLVRAGDNAGDAIDRMKSVIQTGLNKALLQAAPRIEAFVNELTADPAALQERLEKLVGAAEAITKVGMAAVTAAGHVASFIEKLGKGLAIAASGETGMPLGKQIDELDGQIKNWENVLQSHQNVSQLEKEIGGRSRQNMVAGIENQIKELKSRREALSKAQMEMIEAPPPPKPKEEAPKAGSSKSTFEYRPSGDGKGDADRLKREQEQNKRLIDEARAAVATQEELENMKYRTQRAALEQITAEQFGGAVEKNRLLEDLERKHVSTVAGIHAEAVTMAEQERSDKVAQAEQERERFAELEAMTLDHESRLIQQEELAYRARLDAFAKYSEEAVLSMEEHNAIAESLEQEHMQSLHDIRSRQLTSGLRMLADIKDKEARTIADRGAAALQTAATFSKKAFEANKLVNIAQATIDTYKAVQKARAEGGPFLGPILAGVELAAGLANIAAIKNTKFGGGGASGSVSGAGNPNNTTQPAQAAGQQIPQISLNLDPNGFYSGHAVRNLIEQINEALQDGAKLKV